MKTICNLNILNHLKLFQVLQNMKLYEIILKMPDKSAFK